MTLRICNLEASMCQYSPFLAFEFLRHGLIVAQADLKLVTVLLPETLQCAGLKAEPFKLEPETC